MEVPYRYSFLCLNSDAICYFKKGHIIFHNRIEEDPSFISSLDVDENGTKWSVRIPMRYINWKKTCTVFKIIQRRNDSYYLVKT